MTERLWPVLRVELGDRACAELILEAKYPRTTIRERATLARMDATLRDAA